MAFFKFRKVKDSGSGSVGGRAPGPEARVQDMRMRARHRLIGAVALVVLAVIVFPLLFDTEQRPAVIDAPVVIADAGSREPRADAPAAAVADTAVQPVVPATAPEEAATAEAARDTQAAEVTETGDASDADGTDAPEEWVLGPEVEPLAEEPGAPDSEQEPSATRSKIRVASAPSAPREPARTSTSSPAADGIAAGRSTQPRTSRAGDDAEARRALAALQGRVEPQQVAPPPGPQRAQKGGFVVQVGAFAQEAQVRSVQQRIAQAGLQSHTQVVQTGAGPRTRVRVGPYDSRDAAERARAALEKSGLPGQVLTP